MYARRTTLARGAAPLVLGCALAATATAQHAETVLFGEPNSDGLAVPAERRAVAPISSPFYHEDSFITSDVRAWWVRHSFPDLVGGGYASAYAVQVRLALTESIQFVAYKDGFIDFNAPLTGGEDGVIDLAAGVKWAFLQNWETDLHAAVGLGYEFGVGDEEVLQDDDEVRVWASVNKGFDRLHLGGTANFTAGVGSEDPLGDSDRLFLHAHADYWVNEFFSPVVELNYYDTLSNGNNAPLGVTGVDVANLGGGESEDTLTGALGAEVRPADDWAVRAAYETGLNSADDLFGYRWTVSATWSF